jgi:hypothetical protein
MKKHYPTVLRSEETGRVNRDEAVAAILHVRAAKRAATVARRKEQGGISTSRSKTGKQPGGEIPAMHHEP